VTFSDAGGQLTVHVNGTPVPVETRSRRRATAGGAAADTTNGPVSIAAPMPGRIVKVLVSPGDSVAARQGLIVIEAMKMENELRAPRAGTVTAVKVAPGAPVEAGIVVVVIE
jgi:biotin carboxyl carrier protein